MSQLMGCAVLCVSAFSARFVLFCYPFFNLAQVKRLIFVQLFPIVFLCEIIHHFAHGFIIITDLYVVVCVKINMLCFFDPLVYALGFAQTKTYKL